jgi:hypothetical protein
MPSASTNNLGTLAFSGTAFSRARRDGKAACALRHGGLIAGSSGAGDLGPYGVTALPGLAGMFSKQATDKLREVFENLFKTTPTLRADPLKQHSTDTPKPNP